MEIASQGQEIPWLREFLISHSDPSQWIQDLGEGNIDQQTALDLTEMTMKTISRMGNDESLAMLKEVRSRHSSQLPVQPFSEGAAPPEQVQDEELNFINTMVEQTQLFAKSRAKHAD